MLDSRRIDRVLSSSFIYTHKFKKDEYNSLMINYEQQLEFQNKIDNNEEFTCKLCLTKTTDFNFNNLNQVHTSPQRMWCCNCEEWWSGRLGYEKTLLEKIRRKIVRLYSSLPDEWEVIRCNDLTEYFLNKQTNKTQTEHPVYEKVLQKLAKQYDQIKTQCGI